MSHPVGVEDPRLESAPATAGDARAWTLRDLVHAALGILRDDLSDARVSGVAQSHDRVAPGTVFVARIGRRFDGHDVLDAAVAAGAICVIGTRAGVQRVAGTDVPYVRVDDDRWATSALAATFHRHPSRDLTTVGVTGTDGKSTTATLLHHLLQGDDEAVVAGLVSTVGVRIGRHHETLPGHFTTPEATEVHEVLARVRDAGASVAIVESSSHGFALARLEHVAYAIGIWTTFTPEHLDDHGTLEAYLEAKRTLVRRAPIAILNRDDDAYRAFADVASSVISYGTHAEADVRAEGVLATPTGLTFDLLVAGHERLRVALPMVGAFNVHNALAALAAAHLLGVAWRDGVRRLRRFPGVPGRMELVSTDPVSVIVDFAHTAPALAKALTAVATPPGARSIVVIGAAGERDPGKRAPLARAAVRGADLAIFTEEDHRSEDLTTILATMAEAAVAAGATAGEDFMVVPDRRAAIGAALRAARPGDVVLLCGKGHERTLERGDEVLAWNEAAEARAAAARAWGDDRSRRPS